MEMLGPFQVLPLKMLVTRQVIRERMEYKDYLGGIAKDELDRLDWFEGKFIVHSAPMEVRRKGKILTNNEWESLKSLGVRGEKLPRAMIAFLDAKKKEFSILERSNRHGKREWELQDVDGSSKKLDLSTTVKRDPMGPVHGGWSYTEKYIDDGQLTTWRSLIHPKGKVIRGPKTLVAWWHCHLESFCAFGKFLRVTLEWNGMGSFRVVLIFSGWSGKFSG